MPCFQSLEKEIWDGKIFTEQSTSPVAHLWQKAAVRTQAKVSASKQSSRWIALKAGKCVNHPFPLVIYTGVNCEFQQRKAIHLSPDNGVRQFFSANVRNKIRRVTIYLLPFGGSWIGTTYICTLFNIDVQLEKTKKFS